MLFHTIAKYLIRYKSYTYIVFLISLFFLFGAETVLAEPEPTLSKEDANKVVSILNGFITVAAALMGMVTSFITIFIYPGWVNGTFFGLQDYLKELWILVSNVVYFIFAFILIAIAFMNIIGKGEGTWELKQAMPRFIVGILIVPFSWFFVQFILSISAILTVGVLTLPYNSFQDHDLYKKALENQEFAKQEICKDVIISLNGEFPDDAQSITAGEGGDELNEHIKCGKDGKVTIKEILVGKDDGSSTGLENSIFGIMSIYSYGILRIHDLDTLDATQLEGIKKIADLILKIVFDLLFIAVYLLLMIALLLALFVRGVRLWLFMMLSPMFGLLYFFGKSNEGMGEMGEKFNIKEFIALALVPVYVSAALAFGLTFILVASQGIKEKNDGNMDTLQAGGFSLTIMGEHGSGELVESSVIGKLIVEIFGVVILWIAVMAALGASKTTKAIVEPIAKFGNDVGALAAKAPTYAPIIPTGQGMQSAASLSTISGQIKSGIEAKEVERGSSFVKGVMPGSASSVDLSQNSVNAINEIAAKGTLNDASVWDKFKKALREGGSTEKLSGSEQFTNLMNDMLEKAGSDHKVIKGSQTSLLEGLGILDEYARTTARGHAGDDLLLGGDFSRSRKPSKGELDAALSAGSLNVGGAPSPTPGAVSPTTPTGTVNITVNGTPEAIDTAQIQLAGASGARTATINTSVQTQLNGVAKQALIDAGYSDEDAEAIIAAL